MTRAVVGNGCERGKPGWRGQVRFRSWSSHAEDIIDLLRLDHCLRLADGRRLWRVGWECGPVCQGSGRDSEKRLSGKRPGTFCKRRTEGSFGRSPPVERP